jgi:hypothetical protein
LQQNCEKKKNAPKDDRTWVPMISPERLRLFGVRIHADRVFNAYRGSGASRFS